jgi:hypothetical protein
MKGQGRHILCEMAPYKKYFSFGMESKGNGEGGERKSPKVFVASKNVFLFFLKVLSIPVMQVFMLKFS